MKDRKMNYIITKRHILANILILIYSLFLVARAKQIAIVDYLDSKHDRIQFRLVQQTTDYVSYTKIMDKYKYQCRNYLKNQLAINVPEVIQTLPVNIDFNQCIVLQSKIKQSEIDRKTWEVDKILDILNGQCLYYATNTFIYEYCHKEHVRQFDSPQTKNSNAKPEFEDISMGVFHPQKRKARIDRLGEKELTKEERMSTIPKYSNFQSDYNFLVVDDIDNMYGELEIQQSEDGNLIFASSHLSYSDSYITTAPIFISLHCQNSSGGEFVNHAMLVDPYTLIYTNKMAACTNLVDFKLPKTKVEYYKDDSASPIRAYGRYLYGNVEQFCTSNWGYVRKDDKDFDKHLEAGSLIFIEYFNQNTQKIESTVLVVKRVINAQLIEMQGEVGKSFKIVQQYENVKSSIKWAAIAISKITKCNIHLKRQLDYERLTHFYYLGNSIAIMRPNDHTKPIKYDEEYGCLCKIFRGTFNKIFDINIEIFRNLWLDYYQINMQTNVNIVKPEIFKEFIFLECANYRCYPFLSNSTQQKDPQKNSKTFTSIVKVSKTSPIFQFDQKKIDQFYYIINIKDVGIIKLITKGSDGITYTYLLTEGQIIKMAQFENGTKQIIKENKYYENSTLPQNTLYQNYIYIKVSKLPNGTFYGGIWKFSDNVFFPRFQFIGEKLLRLQRKSGYAYIRILNLEKMKNKESISIVRWMKLLEEHYTMKEKEASMFLSQSYSINYTYNSGKYCDPPVNKMRKTIVTLKCGNAWFQIRKLFQTSPCEYWLEIQTLFLCKEGHKEVLESDTNLLNKGAHNSIANNGVLCLFSDRTFDEGQGYIHMFAQ